MAEIKKGDVVELQSGGPKMTVLEVDADESGSMRAWCDWFEGLKKQFGDFPVISLKRAA